MLAAGLGTRMKSRRAKVLHELGGLPLIAHVAKTARNLIRKRFSSWLVIKPKKSKGRHSKRWRAGEFRRSRQNNVGPATRLNRRAACWKTQIRCWWSCHGDMPLIRTETLKKLIGHHRETGAACSILSVEMQNPTGYGRIVRDENGDFQRIVEQRDATAEQRQIREINSGIYCFEAQDLFQALAPRQAGQRTGRVLSD